MDNEERMESLRGKKQSKEEAIYGVFAESDEEVDNDRNIRFNKKGDHHKPDYTTGVSFVSGGSKSGSSLTKEVCTLISGIYGASSNESFKEKEDKRPMFRSTGKPQKQLGGEFIAGMRSSSSSGAPDPNKLTGWAKQGPQQGSVVMNIMKKMGYEQGKGLGREGQGIVEPVQAAVRPGRGAVGAYGREATGQKFGESAAEAQRRAAEEGPSAFEEKEAKPVVPKRARKELLQKVAYVTVDDVDSVERLRAAKHSGTKVIDMRGPESREYTGYGALKSVIDVSTKQSDITDRSRAHNILGLTEEEIGESSYRVRNLKDSLKDEFNIREGHSDKMENLDKMKEKLLERLQDPSMLMNDIKMTMHNLSTHLPGKKLIELEKEVVPIILSRIKKVFSKWQPLERDQVAAHLGMMKEWKDILEPLRNSMPLMGHGKLSAFDRLMWEGWMPPVRSSVLRWDPREEMESMMILVETWMPLMTPWMSDNFIEQLLVPRLTTRVEEWDPVTDASPIHEWLLPWREVVGDRLQPVCAPIRQKMAKALRKWSCTDKSALLMLAPWKDVWTPMIMASFLQQNILPKLKDGLVRMNLEPSSNALYEEFTACISWMAPESLIPPEAIANLLVDTFFPRWYEALSLWLDSPSVEKKDVQMWMKGWTDRFPPSLMASPVVKECLRRGLLALAGQRLSTPLPTSHSLSASPAARGAPEEMKFSAKEALEIMATKRGITYIPQPGKTKDGQQVYTFGKQSIFVNRGMIYVKSAGEWKPIDFQELMSIA
ncbi:hypothetical protein PMAYCL1PPCAC_08859 [Pristionchus mayeri]|uniref:G-patch domain-containing protein n=1 Tax=Pristionchus mayeri TaxID=1317129 RepID=A0AAN4ZEV4_9BILA|nr:hypothetical protein PMAYCL1PPCAC_08859 [Pristionchus mayeri]